MTRRARRRRSSADLRTAALIGLAAFVALVVLTAALHAAGVLLALAAVGGGGYALGRRPRPVTRPAARRPSPASESRAVAKVTAERDRLAATVADLRERLAAAGKAAEHCKHGPKRGECWVCAPVLAAELAGVRRQVDKCEDTIGTYDDQIAELERLAGRPIELVIASYKAAAARYAPAAANGRAPRRPRAPRAEHSPAVSALLADPAGHAMTDGDDRE